MKSKPSFIAESLVKFFVPPVAREYVLGDLAERYRSPGQYLRDALQTVPAVVISQIRRTSLFAFWPVVGSGLCLAYARETQGWWPGAVIAAVATLVAFMFRDAYRVPDLKRPARKGLVDILVVAAVVFALEMGLARYRPEWAITPEGMRGGAIALAVLFLLRLQNPSGRVTTQGGSTKNGPKLSG